MDGLNSNIVQALITVDGAIDFARSLPQEDWLNFVQSVSDLMLMVPILIGYVLGVSRSTERCCSSSLPKGEHRNLVRVAQVPALAVGSIGWSGCPCNFIKAWPLASCVSILQIPIYAICSSATLCRSSIFCILDSDTSAHGWTFRVSSVLWY